MENKRPGRPSKRPSIEEAIQALVPERHRGNAWVCGGYANDPEKALDIDVWILGRWGKVQLRELLDEVKEYLENSGLSNLNWDPHTGSDAPENSSLVVRGFWGGAGMPFDILTSYLTILDLVRSFDISTHQIAENPISREVSYAQLDSRKTGPLICNGNMVTTAGRYMEICERYGFKPFTDSLLEVQRALDRMKELGWPDDRSVKREGFY